MQTLVVYHANCLDGFAAAFAAWLKLGDEAEYLALRHGDAAPDVTGRCVYVLDFCFEREVLARMAAQAERLVVLDHHRTWQEKVGDFSPRSGLVHFDMNKSGARLAWEHFHASEPPALVRFVEDQDLWRWAYPETAAFMMALGVEPRTFAAWKAVSEMAAAEVERFIERGRGMRAKFDAMCANIVADAFEIQIDGVAGLAANAPGEMVSHVGNLLATRSGTFGLAWRVDNARIVRCSLRSNAPFEVEPLARRFGGGGHAQAAAFSLPLERLPELVGGSLRSDSAAG